MANMSRSDDEAHNPAKSTHHRRLAQDRGQLAGSLHPILEGRHYRVWADQRLHRPGCIGHLPGFDPHQHGVNRANVGRVVSGLHRLDQKIAVQTVNLQAALPHRLQMGPPGNKRDIFSGLGQAPAKIAPDPAGPKYSNLHLIQSSQSRSEAT
jgi:hypothetical protein